MIDIYYLFIIQEFSEMHYYILHGNGQKITLPDSKGN